MDAWMIQTIGYVTLFFIGFILANILSKGFMFKYFRVWASRGSKLLVKIHNPMDHYYKIGWIEEGFLRFHDKTTKAAMNKDKSKKNAKRIALPDDHNPVYRCLGVAMIEVSEEKNVLILPDMKAVTGFDANKFNNIITRALSEPRNQKDKTLMMITLILAGAAVLIGIVTIVNVISMQDTINLVQQELHNMNAGKVIPAVVGVGAVRFRKWLF